MRSSKAGADGGLRAGGCGSKLVMAAGGGAAGRDAASKAGGGGAGGNKAASNDGGGGGPELAKADAGALPKAGGGAL